MINYTEEPTFICRYEKKDGKLYIYFGDNEPVIMPATIGNEKIILNRMKEQVQDAINLKNKLYIMLEDIIKQKIKINVFSLLIFILTIILSINLSLMSIPIGLSVLIYFMKKSKIINNMILFTSIIISDIEKNEVFLQYENILNDLSVDKEKLLEEYDLEVRKRIENNSTEDKLFTINNVDIITPLEMEKSIRKAKILQKNSRN